VEDRREVSLDEYTPCRLRDSGAVEDHAEPASAFLDLELRERVRKIEIAKP
jgi:hypothetical protein